MNIRFDPTPLEILMVLRAIKQHPEDRDPRTGICGNMWSTMIKKYNVHLSAVIERKIMEPVKTWKYYSGNEDYPVYIGEGEAAKASAQYDYINNEFKWGNTSYGKRRMSLLKHLIKHYEGVVNGLPNLG